MRERLHQQDYSETHVKTILSLHYIITSYVYIHYCKLYALHYDVEVLYNTFANRQHCRTTFQHVPPIFCITPRFSPCAFASTSVRCVVLQVGQLLRGPKRPKRKVVPMGSMGLIYLPSQYVTVIINQLNVGKYTVVLSSNFHQFSGAMLNCQFQER